MGGPIRVALVDDHPLFREGVASVLLGAGGFEIAGHGSGYGDMLKIARERAPHLMLVDVEMSPDGMLVIRQLLQSFPATKLLMLTASESEAHVSTIMKSGAAGYILKGIDGNELARTLREIHLGARYVDPTLAARILAKQIPVAPAPQSGFPELTSREGQIVGQVARGLTNKEVARALTISEKTVKHYMTSIMQKLHVRNRTELVLVASRIETSDQRAARIA